MSKQVKLLGRLGKDEQYNGLDAYAESLDQDRDQTLMAIVALKVDEVREKVGGENVPYVYVHYLEPIGSPGSIPVDVTELIMKRRDERLGNEALPYGDVVVDDAAEGDGDPDDEQDDDY